MRSDPVSRESHPSDHEFLVLHALRCIGSAGEQRVANAAGLPVEATTGHLRDLSIKGWVVLDPGPFGGWSVTDAGRTADQEMLDSELALTGAGEPVRACYQSFLSLNPTLLQACSDWQMRRLTSSTHILNDHSNDEYDSGVLSRLIRVDDAVQRDLDGLAGHLRALTSTPTACRWPSSGR